MQLPKLRSEIVGEKLGRLIYAIDLLNSKDFNKAWESYEYITTNYAARAWEDVELGAALYGLLNPIDLIAKLIEQKQIAEEELFKAQGSMLGFIGTKIDELVFEVDEPAFFINIVDTYQKGWNLLVKADKWKQKNLPRL